MRIIENLEQGTQEWHEHRRCMITGSKMDSVMGTAWDRLMLICELIAEEATEQVKVLKPTAEMERGTAEEVFARKHFEQVTGKKVIQLGFCISDEFPYVGVSGDGWIAMKKVYEEGMEIKSPDTKNAVFYQLAAQLSADTLGLGTWSKVTEKNPEPKFTPSAKAPFLGIPAQYKWQVLTYFFVNEKCKKMHFETYDPRFITDQSKMHIVTIDRDHPEVQEALKEMRESIISFREFWMTCREKIIRDNF